MLGLGKLCVIFRNIRRCPCVWFCGKSWRHICATSRQVQMLRSRWLTELVKSLIGDEVVHTGAYITGHLA